MKTIHLSHSCRVFIVPSHFCDLRNESLGRGLPFGIMPSSVALGVQEKKYKMTYPDAPIIRLPEINIKNRWLEYYFPIGEAYFQVLC